MGVYKSKDEIWQGKKNVCSFCDNVPQGHWGLSVFVCRDCAVEVLPALIADATTISENQNGYGNARRTLSEVGERFWRAVACRAFFK